MRKVARVIVVCLMLTASIVGTVIAGGTASISNMDEMAKDFSLPKLDGTVFNLKDVLGKKVIVINFWASWCTSCAEEIPQLEKFQRNEGFSNAVFIGINAGENQRKAKRFQEKHGYPYLVLIDKDKSVCKQYNITGLPVTVIISKSGQIIFRGSRPPKTFPMK